MKKTFLLFLLPFCSLILTSCSNGFEMIEQADHGKLGTGFYNQTPIKKEDVANFIKEANSKVNGADFKKYDSYGSDIYNETTIKETNKSNVISASASLIKDGRELTSEIATSGSETKKHIIYTDASEENKVKVCVDKYVMTGDKEEVKSYISNETKKDDSFEFLNDYYQEAKMTYLDNMKYMLYNFSLVFEASCAYADTVEDLLISCYKCETSIKQNKKDELYSTYSFILSGNTNLIEGEIYYSEDFTIKKLILKVNDFKGSSSDIYMSLLPFDKTINPLKEDNRQSVLPKDLSKLIYDFTN